MDQIFQKTSMFIQNQKRFLLLGLVILAVVFVVGTVSFFSTRSKVVKFPASTLNTSGISGSVITVSGIKMNNFYRESKEINKEKDQDLVPAEKDYDIIYFSKTNSFLISILSSPFEEVRQKAESKFLEKTKVTTTDACKLNVSITTPTFANPAESGQIYKLSFCN